MANLSPREIAVELDKHIIGQHAAKRAVAIALRNRWRRMQLPEDLRNEVTPKNILMIGPTGVGKTEIARRLARLAGSRARCRQIRAGRARAGSRAGIYPSAARAGLGPSDALIKRLSGWRRFKVK